MFVTKVPNYSGILSILCEIFHLIYLVVRSIFQVLPFSLMSCEVVSSFPSWMPVPNLFCLSERKKYSDNELYFFSMIRASDTMHLSEEQMTGFKSIDSI